MHIRLALLGCEVLAFDAFRDAPPLIVECDGHGPEAIMVTRDEGDLDAVPGGPYL
jgi:hypothetical protein